MFKKNPFAMYRHVEGKDYLFVENRLFLLKGISKDIWSQMENFNNFEELVNFLSEEYQVEYKKISKDVSSFFNALEKQGLVTK